jgi:hypothetical protein
MKEIFDILEMDASLGRLTTVEDLDPYSSRARTMRAEELLTHAGDPAIAAVYAQVPALEEALGIKLHVDHVLPLARGGSHTASNLQIIPAHVNLKKNDKRLFKY